MRKVASIVCILLAIFFSCNNSYSALEDINNLHIELFDSLSKEIKLNPKYLSLFDKLMRQYIEQGRSKFGGVAVYFTPEIAVMNASLILGHAKGKKSKVVDDSDIMAIEKKFENLFFNMYAFYLPSRMMSINPKFALQNGILPNFQSIIDFSEVKNSYYDILPISTIQQGNKLIAYKAITGFATGIALGEGRKQMTKRDLELAKLNTCNEWPACLDMLSQKLDNFSGRYLNSIRQHFFGDY